MKKIYSNQAIKSELVASGKIMISNSDNVMALRNHICRLRKQGFVIRRVGKIGDIKGYELIDDKKP